jgi:hypothetical protein
MILTAIKVAESDSIGAAYVGKHKKALQYPTFLGGKIEQTAESQYQPHRIQLDRDLRAVDLGLLDAHSHAQRPASARA